MTTAPTSMAFEIPAMMRSLAIAAFLLGTPTVVIAQAPAPPAAPAAPADPILRADPANDFFRRISVNYEDARSQENHAARLNRYAQIVPDCVQYLEQFPNHPNAQAVWYFLGQCYYQTGHIDDGRRCFLTVLNRYGKGPYVANSAHVLAVDHYTKKEYALAATLFERAAANFPQAAERQKAHYYRALCFHQANRLNEALEAYKRAVAENAEKTPFGELSQLAIAKILSTTGRPEDALASLETLAKSSDDPAIRGEAALYAGATASKLGRHQLADTYLTTVLTSPGMEKWRPDAQIALMSDRYEQMQYKEVIEIFERSSTKTEGLKEGRRLLLAGRAQMHLGNHTKAIELFRQAEKEVSPDSDLAFEAAYDRLNCFYQIDGAHVDEQADAFLQIYAKGRPKDSRVHTAMLMKAETFAAARKYREAAETYNQIDPNLVSKANRPGFLFQRGWCLAVAGDSQGAIRSLSKFIEEYPDDPRVAQALGKRAETALADGDRTAALRDFDLLIQRKPAPDLAAFAWQQSARLKKEDGDLDGMISRYSSLLEKVPDLDEKVVANANYWIGWAHAKNDRPQQAIPFLRKARELDAKTYGKPAGLQLAVSFFATQNANDLATEIDLGIKDGYVTQIPEQAMRWVGTQMYNSGRYPEAARFLELATNPDEPRETPKTIWRYLAKARLECKEPAKALVAVEHVLEVEDDPAWVADGLLDKARCLFLVGRLPEARTAAEECLKLHPQGRVAAGIRIILGDIACAGNDLAGAAGHYVVVAELIDDKELKPLALWKAAQIFEKKGDVEEAKRYRGILQHDFPDFKVPE